MRLRLSSLSHCVALVFGAYGVGLFLLGPSMTAIAATYRTDKATVGMSYTAFSVGFLPGVFLAGYLYEQVSRKWTVAAGGGLIGASLVFFASAPAIGPNPVIWIAFAGMACLGFGGSLLELAGNAVMADMNADRPALAVNYVHSLLAVGAIVGPWMAGQLMQAGLSWQIPYVIAGACCLTATIVLALQREPPAASPRKMDIADMRALLRKSIVWVAFAGIGLYVAAETGIVGWVPSFMEENLGASKLSAGSVISVFWFAMTVGRMFCTWGASLLRPQTWVVLLCVLGAAAAAGIGSCRSQALCYVLVGLSGLTFSGIFGMVLAHAASELGKYLGAAYSVIVSGVAIGSLSFPPAMGWIAKASSMRLALIVPAALLAAQALLYLPYILRRQPSAARPLVGG
jgi:FHS family glucose/mannose:H+ symporter-like MFS transporter